MAPPLTSAIPQLVSPHTPDAPTGHLVLELGLYVNSRLFELVAPKEINETLRALAEEGWVSNAAVRSACVWTTRAWRVLGCALIPLQMRF